MLSTRTPAEVTDDPSGPPAHFSVQKQQGSAAHRVPIRPLSGNPFRFRAAGRRRDRARFSMRKIVVGPPTRPASRLIEWGLASRARMGSRDEGENHDAVGALRWAW